MKLAGRIPVEPLGEERLTQIERRVVAGAVDAAIRGQTLRAPRRTLGRAIAAVAIAAAGVAGWTLHAPPGGPVIAEPPALRAQTSPERSRLDIGDATIESDPGTAFAVTRPDGGVLVAMARGKVELEVGKRGARPPLVVRAGDTDVIVVGTHFTVDYGDGSGDVRVRVTEGVVRIVRQQHETPVAAGQEWQTRAGRVATAQDARPEPSAAGSDARGGAPTALPTGRGSTPVGSLGAAPEAQGRTTAAPGILHDRRAAVPDASGAPTAPRPWVAAGGKPAGGEAGRPHPAARDPHVDLKAAIRMQHVEPALDLGEPSAASAIARYYDIAAHQSGGEASQAFYSIAYVAYGKLGKSADALETLDAYVRRFPGGKEYRAALWLRVRILCLDKIDDRCRAAAYTYLHEAPDTPAAHVAELLTQM